MNHWTIVIEGRGESKDAETTGNKFVDELRKNGHDVTNARLNPGNGEPSKDLTQKYAGAGTNRG